MQQPHVCKVLGVIVDHPKAALLTAAFKFPNKIFGEENQGRRGHPFLVQIEVSQVSLNHHQRLSRIVAVEQYTMLTTATSQP